MDFPLIPPLKCLKLLLLILNITLYPNPSKLHIPLSLSRHPTTCLLTLSKSNVLIASSVLKKYCFGRFSGFNCSMTSSHTSSENLESIPSRVNMICLINRIILMLCECAIVSFVLLVCHTPKKGRYVKPA